MDDNFKDPLAQELAQTLINFKRSGFHKDHSLDIRESEFMMLATIVYSISLESKGIKISDLSNKLHITPAAVTHIIDTLVKKKYVERQNDPSDRRLVLIKPTDKGIDLVNSIKTRLIKKCEELVNYLGKKDSKELIRLVAMTFDYLNKSKQ